MLDRECSQCGCLTATATETLTALIGLEVLFKALAMTDGGRDALHAAAAERLDDMDMLSRCGVDAMPNRLASAALREMLHRVAPPAELDVAA